MLSQEGEHSSDVQSRYGYLLKPIRDLCKNWEINIAGELEEYLNEMEHIRISFDCGETVMNFAEAALLIQGSACIYSKKVEYLYKLVYQTLDLTASNRQLQQMPSVDDHGKDKDVSAHEQDRFLLLDDIKEAKNIDLKEDKIQQTSQLIPRTPITLITFDDSKKGSALLSLTGEILGNRNDFKMNTCSVHLSSGALILDTSNVKSLTAGAFLQCQEANDKNAEDKTNIEDMDDLTDHFDDGDEMCVSNGEDMELKDKETLHTLSSGTDAINQDVMVERMQLCKRKVSQQEQISSRKTVKDPWELLDPHDPNGGVEKVFKKGRPFKIPSSIRDDQVSVKKRKRRAQESSPNDEKLISIAEFCKLAYHSQAKKLPKNPLKTLLYHEFEYIFWNEFRRRQILDRKRRKAMAEKGVPNDEIRREFFDDFQENKDDCLDEESDDYDECDAGDVNDDDANGFQDNVNGIQTGGIQPMALEESDDLVVSSYEELVRKYVQGFLVQAQTYVQETDLSRRVVEWERKVVPKLENEDTHQSYDIHKYGEKLLTRFEDAPVKSFEEIVPSQEPWEVCRYFLASLQLANNNNIQIFEDRNVSKMDCMKLKLLHATPAHRAISQYRAPSVLT